MGKTSKKDLKDTNTYPKTYLLTTTKPTYKYYKKYYDEFQTKGSNPTRNWTCANRKSIKKGDRFFLIKLGEEPKGIVASGEVTKGSYNTTGDPYQNHVKIKFENFFDPFDEASILLKKELKKLPKPKKSRNPIHGTTKKHLNETSKKKKGKKGKPYDPWAPPKSGTIIQPHIAPKLEKIWAKHLKHTNKNSTNKKLNSGKNSTNKNLDSGKNSKKNKLDSDKNSTNENLYSGEILPEDAKKYPEGALKKLW